MTDNEMRTVLLQLKSGQVYSVSITIDEYLDLLDRNAELERENTALRKALDSAEGLPEGTRRNKWTQPMTR
jgi:hypothetical protein